MKNINLTGDGILDITLISISALFVFLSLYRVVSLFVTNPKIIHEKQHKQDQITLRDTEVSTPQISLEDRKISFILSVERGDDELSSFFSATRKLEFDIEDCLEGDFPENDLSKFIMADWYDLRQQVSLCHGFMDSYQSFDIPTVEEGKPLDLVDRFSILNNQIHQLPNESWETTEVSFDEIKNLKKDLARLFSSGMAKQNEWVGIAHNAHVDLSATVEDYLKKFNQRLENLETFVNKPQPLLDEEKIIHHISSQVLSKKDLERVSEGLKKHTEEKVSVNTKKLLSRITSRSDLKTLLNSLLEEFTKETEKSLSKIDFEGLNKKINDLSHKNKDLFELLGCQYVMIENILEQGKEVSEKEGLELRKNINEIPHLFQEIQEIKDQTIGLKKQIQESEKEIRRSLEKSKIEAQAAVQKKIKKTILKIGQKLDEVE